MVNTFLVIVSVTSLLAWIMREKYAREQLHYRLDEYIRHYNRYPSSERLAAMLPRWSEPLLKVILALWLFWIVCVFLFKDGDFALILVMLTLLAGIISGLDKFYFSRKRLDYINTLKIDPASEAASGSVPYNITHVFLRKELPIAEHARSLFPILLIVLLLRSFVVEPFQIPSSSMMPTLEIGDYILVNKFNYGLRLPVLGTSIIEFKQPQRGDVVVFFPPHDSRYFIKRIIGLPGDHITYTNKVLTINGELMRQEVLAKIPPVYPILEIDQEQLGHASHLIQKNIRVHSNDFSIIVEPDHYFMMGDNRDNSGDSRVWGTVPKDNIVGQAFAIWMHWSSLAELPSFKRVGLIQ